MQYFRCLCALVALITIASPAGAANLLQNDGFFAGQNAVFQGGFVAG